MSIEEIKTHIEALLRELNELIEKDQASLMRDETLELRKIIKTQIREIKNRIDQAVQQLEGGQLHER